MERKRKCFEPPRPLTLGSASNERGDEGHSDNVPAQRQSDIETAQGSLAFIARVLAQSQNASREHSSELNAEQERHAQTRRALRRANIERIDAIQQLSSATQAVHELNRELQTERARHENTKLALSDERAAHAQTEKARQQAVDTLNDTIGQPKSRRESAAGVGSMLAQERGIREQGSPRTTAVDPLPLQQVALSDATRALNTPFRRSVSSLRNQLGRHANAPQSGGNSSCLSDSPPQPFAGSPAAAAVSHSSSNCNTDDVADVSTSTGAWAAEYANDDGQGSDGDEQETTDRPMIASPRPVRNRHAPSRWQDGKLHDCTCVAVWMVFELTCISRCRRSHVCGRSWGQRLSPPCAEERGS